jgi:hypothetical protein
MMAAARLSAPVRLDAGEAVDVDIHVDRTAPVAAQMEAVDLLVEGVRSAALRQLGLPRMVFVPHTPDKRAFLEACVAEMGRRDRRDHRFKLKAKGVWVPDDIFPAARERLRMTAREGAE